MGRSRVAVIDPGPALERHIRAVESAVMGAGEPPEHISILVTHWHGDHAGAARGLARALRARGVPASQARIAGPGKDADVELGDGDAVRTDEGDLVAVSTPGHSRTHLCYLWPERKALFAGDLLLGEGDTTWVGEYAGCVTDYLRSLERVAALDPEVVYPAHGPAVTSPREVVARFRAHRLQRVDQVRAALGRRPDASLEQLMDVVYGRGLPERAVPAARSSLEAILAHLRGE